MQLIVAPDHNGAWHFGVNQLQTARDARDRFHSCRMEPLAGILLSSSISRIALHPEQCVTTKSSAPPDGSTSMRTYLQCHPGTRFSSSRSVLNARHCGKCPHEGSARRPDMGILRHRLDAALSDSRTCSEVQVGTEPAILVHTSDNTIRSKFKVPSGLNRSSR